MPRAPHARAIPVSPERRQSTQQTEWSRPWPRVTSPANDKVTGDVLLGRTIEGKYRIDAKLGAGGMGAVYRAHRLLIGDDVALKILHPEHVSQPDATERFRREAQAAARLKHANAVSIYDFGVTNDGLVYLVMELVEGQSLREIIKQQGPLTPSAAAEVISQVCAALDEAHRQQIVHRDLKPDNIVVKPMLNGLRVKVLDFGIAKLRDLTAGNLTQTGSVMGTPHYMSPEQCLGEELDSRSDIYSLGIVLYEMLAGVVPFNSPMSTAVVVQHVNQAPPPLRTINLSISTAVEAVVMHALAKQRQERPQSAAALAEELRNELSPMPSFASQQRTPTPTFAAQAPSFPNSQPTAQAPTVVLRTPGSGSSAAYGAPTSPIPPAYSTQPQPLRRHRNPLRFSRPSQQS
ncbi:MAG: protein kinase domain-containing protein [Acidobacteriota bacterium]